MSQEEIGVLNTKMSSLKTTTKCQEEVGLSVGSETDAVCCSTEKRRRRLSPDLFLRL